MTYAVISAGGKQFRVAEGSLIDIERTEGEVGSELRFDKVLLLNDGSETKIGTPHVEGATVVAEVVRQYRDKKVIVYKFRRRQNYRKKQGHRQYKTVVKVTSIQH